MTPEDVEKTLERLQYHIETLARTIDFENHPVEALIVQMNWDKSDIDTAHDIFERWDRKLDFGDSMNQTAFEKDFQDELGVGYQRLKFVVNAFHKNGQWTNVCQAYVATFGNQAPVEFHSILRRSR